MWSYFLSLRAMILKEYIPFYRRNIKVALPVMITQAGQVVVQLADNIMVGQLGAAQLAGISFANAIIMIGVVFAIGFTQGATPMVGQAYGKGDKLFVSRILCNSAVLNFIMMAILCTVMFAVGRMMGLMGQDPEVLAYAEDYYYISVVTMLPLILFCNIRFFSEGIGNTKYAMWITIATNLLNILLNWMLIYGELGAPRLEVAGAAYATLISRAVAALVFLAMLFYVKEYRQYIRIIPRKVINFREIKDLLSISFPISLQNLLEVTAFSFAAIMVGWFGKYELAAHQITQSLSQVSFMVATGIGAAATIRVSHQYGGGHYYETYMAGKASVHMAIAFMTLCGALFIIFIGQIPLVFTDDPNVIPIARKLILVLSLFQIFDAIQLSSMSSLRGLKDIRRPLLYSAISYYGICLPSAYLLGFVVDLGPVGVWIGLLLGLAVAALLFYSRFRNQCKKFPVQKRQTLKEEYEQ